MQAIVPNPAQVNYVLARLASAVAPSDVELTQLLSEPVIDTGLDHWALWTLMCLRRHIERQKWVGYVVESRLKGDLRQIGCAGAFGHPEGMPQSGKVPDEPDWKYYFHGCGCCLTNELTGASIDVDFTPEGESDRIDRFFYSNFLLSDSSPEFPEQVIRRPEPFQHSWQVEIDRLLSANCISTQKGLRLTTTGLHMVDTLEPLVKQISQLVEWRTTDSIRKAVYAVLAVGDAVLASQLASQTDVDFKLQAEMVHATERAKQARLKFLDAALQGATTYAPEYLSAVADLGPELSEDIVKARLFKSPADGAANTALEILRAWNRPDLADVLKELINHRYEESTGLRSLLQRLRMAADKPANPQPRNHQVTQATLALFQRVRHDKLDTPFRKRLHFLIKNAGGAHAGEAALLMYLVDKSSGLQCLRQALSGRVRAAHKDAAAACVIIGDKETEQILKAALNNEDKQIQHTAACALAVFPSQEARDTARQWFMRNDGINEPSGNEVTVLGRTGPVFTFEDISHANMDAFFKWSLDKLRKDFKSVV